MSSHRLQCYPPDVTANKYLPPIRALSHSCHHPCSHRVQHRAQHRAQHNTAPHRASTHPLHTAARCLPSLQLRALQVAPIHLIDWLTAAPRPLCVCVCVYARTKVCRGVEGFAEVDVWMCGCVERCMKPETSDV